MASATRTWTRALCSAPITSTSIHRTALHGIQRSTRPFQHSSSRRSYTSTQPLRSSVNAKLVVGGGLAAALIGGFGSYYLVDPRPTHAESPDQRNKATRGGGPKEQPAFREKTKQEPVRCEADYQAVYDTIAARLIEHDDYDDGSYGPIVLRLGWHASGTYDARTATGGSNGGTMRFKPEAGHGGNKGLEHARAFLVPIKARFPWISYGDLWTLAAVCAVQEMGGPDVAWRPGRQDRAVEFSPPEGRLPNGDEDENRVRKLFRRMGLNDCEAVALTGAHALGRCHTDRSGYDGPWTFSPITFTNDYFKFLVDEKWEWKDWDGPRQYVDSGTRSLMMLPADMALVQDDVFVTYVRRFAEDEGYFFSEFSKALTKLFELGVPFQSTEHERFVFKRTE